MRNGGKEREREGERGRGVALEGLIIDFGFMRRLFGVVASVLVRIHCATFTRVGMFSVRAPWVSM